MEAPKNIQDASQEKLIKGGFSITFIIQRTKLHSIQIEESKKYAKVKTMSGLAPHQCSRHPVLFAYNTSL